MKTNEKHSRIAMLRVIKTPAENYTAIGYSIGDIQPCDYYDLINQLKTKKKVDINLGQGDGCTFNADEIEIVEIRHREEWTDTPSAKELKEFKLATLGLKGMRKEKLNSLKK